MSLLRPLRFGLPYRGADRGLAHGFGLIWSRHRPQEESPAIDSSICYRGQECAHHDGFCESKPEFRLLDKSLLALLDNSSSPKDTC